MSLAIALVLLVVSAAFVAAPFFAGDAIDPSLVPTPMSSRGELEQRKLEAYGAIKDAEMDYRMGKLSDADFASLKEKYTHQAADALAGLEALAPTPLAQTAAASGTELRYCPSCGTRLPETALFCPGCGAGLRAAA